MTELTVLFLQAENLSFRDQHVLPYQPLGLLVEFVTGPLPPCNQTPPVTKKKSFL